MDYKSETMWPQAYANYRAENYPHCQSCSTPIRKGEKYCMTGKPCDYCNKVSCGSWGMDICPHCKEPKFEKNRQDTLDKYFFFAVQSGTLDEIKSWVKRGANAKGLYNHRSILFATKDEDKIKYLSTLQ